MKAQTSTLPVPTPPSSAATYERARRLANVSMWKVALQRRRIETAEPQDNDFLFRRWADFDFLIVSLSRLRRAACLAATIPELQSQISLALAAFDADLPGLNSMRNVAEHVDDYALDRGRKKSVARQGLEVSTLTDDGITLHWLGHSLNADDAIRAGQALFKSIQDALPSVPRDA
jgi:hypothetical protein